MRSIMAFPMIVCVLIMGVITLQAAVVVDRIVVTVNGYAILQSDWVDAIRYEAFVAKRALDATTSAERSAALDHLVDQELLREQMHAADFAEPTKQELDSQMAEIRNEYQGADSDEVWKNLLASYGLPEAKLRRRVAFQLQMARVVDAHLRPSTNVGSESVEIYYREKLLPKLRSAGEKEVPLAQVRSKIQELLAQQKINALLITWLQNLHSGSEIRVQEIKVDR